jgi:ATP-dependent DNA ligase
MMSALTALLAFGPIIPRPLAAPNRTRWALTETESTREPLVIFTARKQNAQLPATYVVFDLLYDRFESLLVAVGLATERAPGTAGEVDATISQSKVGPLARRRRLGKALFAEVRRLGLEGMMAKCLTCCYRPGRRTDAWIKIKPREAKKPLS